MDQIAGFEAQIRDLQAAGAERIFSEQVSALGDREQFEAAMDFVREGDVFCVTKLDRLARSVADASAIFARLAEKGVSLRVLNLGLDTSTPTGKLMLNMLSAIAEFERELMLERQREGIAKAKAEGKYKGRAPTALAKADQVRELAATGITKVEIAKTLGIGEASVYRILKSDGAS